MEEGDLNGGDISDSPTISDARTLSDSEADPGRASDFFDYTPSQSFTAPESYLEVKYSLSILLFLNYIPNQ